MNNKHNRRRTETKRVKKNMGIMLKKIFILLLIAFFVLSGLAQPMNSYAQEVENFSDRQSEELGDKAEIDDLPYTSEVLAETVDSADEIAQPENVVPPESSENVREEDILVDNTGADVSVNENSGEESLLEGSNETAVIPSEDLVEISSVEENSTESDAEIMVAPELRSVDLVFELDDEEAGISYERLGTFELTDNILNLDDLEQVLFSEQNAHLFQKVDELLTGYEVFGSKDKFIDNQSLITANELDLLFSSNNLDSQDSNAEVLEIDPAYQTLVVRASWGGPLMMMDTTSVRGQEQTRNVDAIFSCKVDGKKWGEPITVQAKQNIQTFEIENIDIPSEFQTVENHYLYKVKYRIFDQNDNYLDDRESYYEKTNAPLQVQTSQSNLSVNAAKIQIELIFINNSKKVIKLASNNNDGTNEISFWGNYVVDENATIDLSSGGYGYFQFSAIPGQHIAAIEFYEIESENSSIAEGQTPIARFEGSADALYRAGQIKLNSIPELDWVLMRPVWAEGVVEHEVPVEIQKLVNDELVETDNSIHTTQNDDSYIIPSFELPDRLLQADQGKYLSSVEVNSYFDKNVYSSSYTTSIYQGDNFSSVPETTYQSKIVKIVIKLNFILTNSRELDFTTNDFNHEGSVYIPYRWKKHVFAVDGKFNPASVASIPAPPNNPGFTVAGLKFIGFSANHPEGILLSEQEGKDYTTLPSCDPFPVPEDVNKIEVKAIWKDDISLAGIPLKFYRYVDDEKQNLDFGEHEVEKFQSGRIASIEIPEAVLAPVEGHFINKVELVYSCKGKNANYIEDFWFKRGETVKSLPEMLLGQQVVDVHVNVKFVPNNSRYVEVITACSEDSNYRNTIWDVLVVDDKLNTQRLTAKGQPKNPNVENKTMTGIKALFVDNDHSPAGSKVFNNVNYETLKYHPLEFIVAENIRTIYFDAIMTDRASAQKYQTDIPLEFEIDHDGIGAKAENSADFKTIYVDEDMDGRIYLTGLMPRVKPIAPEGYVVSEIIYYFTYADGQEEWWRFYDPEFSFQPDYALSPDFGSEIRKITARYIYVKTNERRVMFFIGAMGGHDGEQQFKNYYALTKGGKWESSDLGEFLKTHSLQYPSADLGKVTGIKLYQYVGESYQLLTEFTYKTYEELKNANVTVEVSPDAKEFYTVLVLDQMLPARKIETDLYKDEVFVHYHSTDLEDNEYYKLKIERALNSDESTAVNYNITLIKVKDGEDGPETEVSETKQPMTVDLLIPENISIKDGKMQNYELVHSTNGIEQKLDYQLYTVSSGKYYAHFENRKLGTFKIRRSGEITPNLLGDVNLDGLVDIKDVLLLAAYINKANVTPRGIVNGDVDGKKDITIHDLLLLAAVVNNSIGRDRLIPPQP